MNPQPSTEISRMIVSLEKERILKERELSELDRCIEYYRKLEIALNSKDMEGIFG